MSDLISFINGEKDLPERCVLLTIDDGHYSVYKYVYPLLAEYNCKANLSIIGEFVERSLYRKEIPQTNYWMNWEEISELSNSSFFEIGSHSNYLHHSSPRHGTSMLENETVEEYKNCLISDMQPLNSLISSYCKSPSFFAYPYNDPSYESMDILVNDLNYDLLLVGNGNYFSMTKNKTNYYAFGIGLNNLFTRLIRRVGRYPEDNMDDILYNLYN